MSRFKIKIFLSVLIGACLVAATFISPAFADTMQDIQQSVDQGLDNIDFSQMEQVAAPFFQNFVEKVRQIINGEFDTAQSFWETVQSMFGSNLSALLPQLISIFCVLVLCGLVRHTSQGFVSADTEKVVSFVGVCVVLVSVLGLVVEAYKQVVTVIDQISLLTDAAMPILLTLVVANGGNAASAVCQPSMVMFSSVIVGVVKHVVLPLSVFALAFVIVSNISENLRVNKTSHFLTEASSWILGVLFTVFSAFTTVYGISAASVDGISYRAAKFAAKNYIPILGGYISDGMDIIVAGTSLIKNAFGAVSLLLVFFMALRPLVTLICVNLGLQAVAAASEPIVDGRYVKMIGGISKCLTFLAVLVVAVAFMFCILTLVAILSANAL